MRKLIRKTFFPLLCIWIGFEGTAAQPPPASDEVPTLPSNDGLPALDVQVTDNTVYQQLKDFYFTNGFSLEPALELLSHRAKDTNESASYPDQKTRPAGGVRSNRVNGDHAPANGLGNNFCWYATAKKPECHDILDPSKVISFFPPKSDHPSESLLVAFLSAVNEQMSTQKCGLYCVLQNYPFANYLSGCEICLCGVFMERLPAQKAGMLFDSATCVPGTGLVGVGINATIQSIFPKSAQFSRTGTLSLLTAGEEYEFTVKIWHWNRFGFVTVVWDLGNDSIRPNETVEIQNNGFGFLRKRVKYSSPGSFRLKIVADDGFHEVFQDLPIEVAPSEGKTFIALAPVFPHVKEPAMFRAPEFSDDPSATYMWFFQDSMSFAESTLPVGMKTYDEPGVYRVDLAVSTSNLSKTGSIDVVVEGPLEGLRVVCEATVNVNRIVNVAVTIDRGTNFNFALENGHSFVEPIMSPSGRFRLLYSRSGLYNLSVTASNHISKLHSIFSINVVDPDLITIHSFDVPSMVVINETVTFRVVADAANLHDFHFEWRFSDNSQASGSSMVNVRKKFLEAGEVHIRLIITGKKGTRKVLHGVTNVVTVCNISPLRGLSLETKFQLLCRGSQGPLPGLEIHHAVIANNVLGFYEILYPRLSHSLVLPDTLSAERNWTIAFPGHSGCDIREPCSDNCCPIFRINVTATGVSRNISEILELMDKLLHEDNKDEDEDHILSVIIAQSSVILKTNLTENQRNSVTNIVAHLAGSLSATFKQGYRVFLGGHLYHLLRVLSLSDGFQIRPSDAACVLRFLVKFVNDMAPQSYIPTPKEQMLELVKRILTTLSVSAISSPQANISALFLLKPLGQLVGSYVDEVNDQSVLLTPDVSVIAIKVNVSRGPNNVQAGDVSIVIPPEISGPLSGTQVVVVVGRANSNWLTDDETSSLTSVFSVSLLDRNFTEIDLTSHIKDSGIKILLPSVKSANPPTMHARTMSLLPVSVKLFPRTAARFRVVLNPDDRATSERFYVSLKTHANVTGNTTGRVSLTWLDGSDTILEKRLISYGDLRQNDVIVRWNFAAATEMNYFAISNDGMLHVEIAVQMIGMGCREPRSSTLASALSRETKNEDRCEPDVSTSANNMRTCICDRLDAFEGRIFEVTDFLVLERTVELHQEQKSVVALSALASVAAVYLLALIITALRHRPQENSRHVLFVGSGINKLHVLFWQNSSAGEDVNKGGLFPLKLHIVGFLARMEHVLSLQRQVAYGSHLLVTILSDRHLGPLSSVRITGRLAESRFPFHYATILDEKENTFYHYRLTPPRLIEETRGGVVFEVASKPTSFPSSKIIIMECRRRIASDHLWISAAQIKGSISKRVEMLSVAATTLFAFMGVCAMGYSFVGPVDDINDLTRPFRPRTRDLLYGLWTALLVTPLVTIVIEILHRSHRRSTKAATNNIPPEPTPCPAMSEASGPTVASDNDSKNHSHLAGSLQPPPAFSQSMPSLVRMEDDTLHAVLPATYNTMARARRLLPNRLCGTVGILPQLKHVAMPVDDETEENDSTEHICKTAKAETEEGAEGVRKRGELCSVSPICRQLLAYFLSFTLSSLSVCLVLLLGLNYGTGLSLRWLLSVAVAFVVSFLVVEPAKILVKTLYTAFKTKHDAYFRKMLDRCRREQ